MEEYTNGFVRFIDLTFPLALPRADWVLSLEVGEHIPAKMEGMYLRNLHAHNCRGIVISWAGPGQRGTGHINLRPRKYALERFAELGYQPNEPLLEKIRASPGGWPQIRRNIFVMVREHPAC